MTIISNTSIAGLLELEEFSHQTIVDQAARSAWGAIGLCGDHDQIEQILRDGTTISGIPTFASHWDAYDAIVDSGFATTDPDSFGSIQAAIDDNKVSIFVNAAIEEGTITIAGGDSVQRIIGKDADTVAMPVALTMSKDDVAIEQLGFSSTALSLNASRIQARDLLVSASGTVVFTATGTLKALFLSRFVGNTATNPVTIDTNASSLVIDRCFFLSTSGGTTATNITSGGVGDRISIQNCIFLGSTTGAQVANNVSGAGWTQCSFSNNQVLAATNGGLDIYGSQNTFEGNSFIGSSGTSWQLRLNSGAGVDIETRVVNNSFLISAGGGAHVCFEYAGADADGIGLLFMGNVAPDGGTFMGSQDMQWIGNDLRGCTLDFQSKTGQIIVGGDLTAATLSNANADLIIWGVKGQDNRGDITHSVGKLILNDSIPLVLGTGEDATIQYDGTDMQMNARAVGTGDWVWKGDMLPQADDTYDLGAAGKEWKDLYVDGTANIDNLSAATLSSTMTPNLDSTYFLGSNGLRWINLYLDALDVQGNIIVGGTVDGVDIAARDHAEAHTVASHSDTTATGAETETLTDGSDADALHDHDNHGVTHNAAHTVASHSDTTATGAETETLTDGSNADSLHVHAVNYTVELWWPIINHVNATEGGQDDIPIVIMTDTEKTRLLGYVPGDYVSTVSCDLIIYPDATETIQMDFSIASLAVGEAATANQTITANVTKDVTAAQITEWDLLTADGGGSVLPTVAAGDYLAIRMDSDTANIQVMGVKFVYVRSA